MFAGRIVLRLVVAMGLLAALLAFASVGAAQVLPYSGELAYVSYRGANADIYLLDIARAQSFNLTHHRAYDAEPSWSPDGKLLAFISDREGQSAVFVMNANGGAVRRITDGSRAFYHPVWSADGKRVIFVTAVPGQQQVVYSASADGGDLRQLTRNSDGDLIMDVGIDRAAQGTPLSPDGRYLLDLRYENGWFLVVLEARSREPARVESMGWYYMEPPIWSPAGDRIAYIGYQQGGATLFLLDLNAPPSRRLTTEFAQANSLTWRPPT